MNFHSRLFRRITVLIILFFSYAIIGKFGVHLTLAQSSVTAALALAAVIFQEKLTRDELSRINTSLASENAERLKVEEQLQASLRDKEVMLREIHHRVKNNLQVVSSLLRLQAGYLSDPSFKEILIESEERVRSIALVHEKLYRSKTLSAVNFKSYLEELARHLVAAHQVKHRQIDLQLQIQDTELSIEDAIPCGLILNELISNALKHAFSDCAAGVLKISLATADDNVTIRVSDDGKGIPSSVNLDTPKTLGLKVCKTLSSQLDATLLQTSSDKGATFELTFTQGRKQGNKITG